MAAIKKGGWKTKFNGLPLLLKIVVAWVYFISILNLMKFVAALVMRLSLDPFALAFGYLIWELAGGLVNRSNLARIIALVSFGLSTAVTVYVIWNGGKVSFDGLDLSASYVRSIFWIVTSCVAIFILLLPQVRRLFSNSAQEEITQ